MCIVYVLPSRLGLALSQFEMNKVKVAPNYNLVHWGRPHVNRLVFAELDSYDIRGMSAMIYRSVPHHRIRYILGTRAKGVEGYVGLLCESWIACIMSSLTVMKR